MRTIKPPPGLAVLAVWLGLTTVAQGQTIDSTAEPGLIEQQRQLDVIDDQAPGIELPQVQGAPAPAGAEELRFMLNELSITGATAVEPASLAPLWQAQLGQEISVADLFVIAAAITKAYADAGYALSFAFVPEQQIGGGRATIHVVEGFVDEVRFVDGAGQPLDPAMAADGELQAYARHIVASRPLRTADLERYLLLADTMPGVTARAVVVASETTENAATLVVEVSRQRIEGAVTLDNRAGRDLNDYKLGATASLNGVFDLADRLTATALISPTAEELRYGEASYQRLIGGDGLLLSLTGSYSRTVPDVESLRVLDYEGSDLRGDIFLAYPLIRGRDLSLTVGSGFGFSNTESEVLGDLFTEDRIRAVRADATLTAEDDWGGRNSLSLSLQQGLKILGATEDDSPLKSRSAGSAGYTLAELTAYRLQELGGPFALFAQVHAQTSFGQGLLSPVECKFGGAGFGRAYDAGTLSTDSCVQGLLEARYTGQLPELDSAYQGYLFIDAGIGWQAGALVPGEPREADAGSAGIGVRVVHSTWLSGYLEAAVPFDRELSRHDSYAPQVFFSLSASF